MSKIPLVTALNNHRSKKAISFHVPGHKGGLLFEGTPDFKKFLEIDLTELTGLDDLHAPEGVIAEAESKLMNFYGTIKSYFLVGGSTVGNLAMIHATVKRGEQVIVQRNCHKSVFNGLKLVNASPIFISPEINKELSVVTGPSIETLERAIEINSTAKVLILTYPNYYGHVFDIKNLIDLAHSKGMIVLVDEAHGAHFQIGSPFPMSAVSLGADIVVQSAHKTLPAMTMGSWMHINSNRVSVKKVKEYLEMLQSSSPSYPIMMSLDRARNYLEEFSLTDVDYTIQEIKDFTEKLNKIDGIKVLETNDLLKLIIQNDRGLTGKQLQQIFEENGVYPELSDHKNVLFILPLLKKGAKYPFGRAITAIDNGMRQIQEVKEDNKQRILVFETAPISTLQKSFIVMESCNEELVMLEDAIDKVSAETITPYPPGIPLIIRGEKITNDMIDNIKMYLQNKIKLQGGHNLSNMKIVVFK
ncbi:MAG: arginine decarboxylase [Bacillales bacterium]|jgi:arginine/lysine/ornithine decarboxylase|nr:arginine decarboxylase [Bacillales bacterium]